MLEINNPISLEATALRVQAAGGKVRVQFDIVDTEGVDLETLVKAALRGRARVILTPVITYDEQVPMDVDPPTNGANGHNGHVPYDGQIIYIADPQLDPIAYHVIEDGRARCGIDPDMDGRRRLIIEHQDAVSANLTLTMCPECVPDVAAAV